MWHVNLAPVCLLYIWVRFKRISVCDSVTGYNGWTDSNGHKYDTWCVSAACTRGRMIDHTDHNTFYGCYSSFMWLAAIHPITHTHAYIPARIYPLGRMHCMDKKVNATVYRHLLGI